MRDVPESITLAADAPANSSPETTSTICASPQKNNNEPNIMTSSPQMEEKRDFSSYSRLPPPPPPPGPPPQAATKATTTAKPTATPAVSLYAPSAQEPQFVGQRIEGPPLAGHEIDFGNLYSRFPTMEEVSKYASDLANGLYKEPKNDSSRQQASDDEQQQHISDELTVTSQYLTLKSLCALPKMTDNDIASWAYVMSAFQTNKKEDGRDDAAAKAPVADRAPAESSEGDVRDEPIPHLHEHSDDDSCDDDSVVLDIDAPLEEAEALNYIDAMEAAALEMKYPDWSVHVVGQKTQPDCHIGILFAKKTPTAPLIVQRVGSKGIFSSSDLLPGMVIREINRKTVAFGVDPEGAFLALKSASPGEVSILAEGLVCTVQRLQRKQKIGLKLKEDDLGNVIVTKITNKSIFKGTVLQPGMTIQSINGQLCPLSAKAAKLVMKETLGLVQLVLIDSTKLERERISMVESGKIDQQFRKQNKISVMTQEPAKKTPPAPTAAVPPMLSETTMLLRDGASRFEVTVSSAEFLTEPGISFSRLNRNAPLMIDTIDKDGIFGDSSLVEGMAVVSINGENMTWKEPNEAFSALASSNHVTIVAEAHVTTIVKTNAAERVGMTLKKRADSQNKVYIDQFPFGSKFASTSLQPGMVLLTINGTPCPKTIKETRALFGSVGEGELTVMAVNVDRQKDPQRKQHQQQKSMEVMETLNALAVSPSNSHSGMIFGNDSTEEDGGATDTNLEF